MSLIQEEKVLKSAWQIAKELAGEKQLDINSAKVEIIRAGKKGIVQTYLYKKNNKTINVYDEAEVRAVFKLADKLGGFQIRATSYELVDGGWIPQLDVAENRGKSIDVMLWTWHFKKYPTKDAADKYAQVAGSQKLRRMIEEK